MAYFGSTIEGAANTAWQAANSIADRENANRWQQYNAIAQQQQQQAAMEQARFANQQAMRQAAESDYFRRAQMQTAAKQFQTQVGLTREQMAQQAADRSATLGLNRERLTAEKEFADKSQADIEAARSNQPNLFGYDWINANKDVEDLKTEAEKIRASIFADQKMAMRWGGQVDPKSNLVIFPKGFKPDYVLAAAPYNQKIQDAMNRLNDNIKKYQVAETERQRIEREARQQGVSFRQDPKTGTWMGYSIYLKQPVALDYFGTPPRNEPAPAVPNAPVSTGPVSRMPTFVPEGADWFNPQTAAVPTATPEPVRSVPYFGRFAPFQRMMPPSYFTGGTSSGSPAIPATMPPTSTVTNPPTARVLDRATAEQILRAAGGDKAKARQMAINAGYTF